MKAYIYITILLTILSIQNSEGQFAAALTNDGFHRLNKNTIVLESENANLRGQSTWQSSTDSVNWTDLPDNVLNFSPSATKLYRMKTTEGDCDPVFSDTVKVYAKTTTVSMYLEDGISPAALIQVNVSIDDLLADSISIDGISGKFLDQEGDTFNWVGIGNQIWMAENLSTRIYASGDSIEYVDSADWGSNTTGAVAYYEDSAAYDSLYGSLYNWHATNNNKGLCPDGWSIPADSNWKSLKQSIVGSGVATNTTVGNTLKSEMLWDPAGTNNFGFNALPGGYRQVDPILEFVNLGSYVYFWTSTEESSNKAVTYYLDKNSKDFFKIGLSQKLGASVRCIKD